MRVIDEKIARTLAANYGQYEKLVTPLYERNQENTHEPKRPRIEQPEKA